MNAKAYTSTQLIKFGSVVIVCTIFLNLAFLISVRKIAKMTGRTEVKMPNELIANVFCRTRTISCT